MCWRLHPVSSLLRSDSWWYDSSLEWAFRRSLGLADTQQEVVPPISALYQLQRWGYVLLPTPLQRELGNRWVRQAQPRRAGQRRSPERIEAHPHPSPDPVSRRCPRRGCGGDELLSLPPVVFDVCTGPSWRRYPRHRKAGCISLQARMSVRPFLGRCCGWLSGR